MDPRRNPFSPNAGTPPRELAGRDALIELAEVALDRIRSRQTARSVTLHRLRCVGKTILLGKIRLDAEARGLATVAVESPEERLLPARLSQPCAPP
jgi:hypothetical protein